MKKIFEIILTAIMVLSLGLTAFAAETFTKQDESFNIDIRAKSLYISPENMYDKSVICDNASIKTKNDTLITISTSGATLDGLTLNVIEIVKDDEAAYSWISGVMSGHCDKFSAYDIFFTDKNGDKVDLKDSVNVSITTPTGYNNVQVYQINSSEKADKIDSKQSDGNTVFALNGINYYALADKSNIDDSTSTTASTTAQNNEKQTDSETITNSNAPQTGDNSNVLLYLIKAMLSLGVIIVLVIHNKRRNQITE